MIKKYEEYDMVVQENKKMDQALSNLLSRQNYLVVQGNDLARSLGNLTKLEHEVLDFCFSFVKKEDEQDMVYQTKVIDLIHHLGLNASGRNYQRIVKAFKALNENTAIYLQIQKPSGDKGILMTSLFDRIALFESGSIEFRFSRDVAPFIFKLKDHFYSFKLAELSRVRSKYTLTLMKLWNANSQGKLTNAKIQGTLEEWEHWFLGSDKSGHPKKMSAGIFKRDVLKKALNEIDRMYPDVTVYITTKKKGVRVIGYTIDIIRVQTTLTI